MRRQFISLPFRTLCLYWIVLDLVQRSPGHGFLLKKCHLAAHSAHVTLTSLLGTWFESSRIRSRCLLRSANLWWRGCGLGVALRRRGLASRNLKQSLVKFITSGSLVKSNVGTILPRGPSGPMACPIRLAGSLQAHDDPRRPCPVYRAFRHGRTGSPPAARARRSLRLLPGRPRTHAGGTPSTVSTMNRDRLTPAFAAAASQ